MRDKTKTIWDKDCPVSFPGDTEAMVGIALALKKKEEKESSDMPPQELMSFLVIPNTVA